MSSKEYRDQEDHLMEKVNAIDRAYEQYAKAKGLTYMSLSILELLFKNQKEYTQKQICEITHYPKQTVNLIMKSFLENGYIELKEAKADRRNKTISLTGIGEKYAEEIVTPALHVDEEAFSKLSAAERNELSRLIGMYAKAYCEGLKKYM